MNWTLAFWYFMLVLLGVGALFTLIGSATVVAGIIGQFMLSHVIGGIVIAVCGIAIFWIAYNWFTADV